MIHVKTSSALEYKKALAAMARYFKAKFKFDHPQHDEFDEDDGCVGVLISERALDLVEHEDHFSNYVVGGCCFQTKASGERFLDWIWLHPFARNRGKLKALWPKFRDRFGTFCLSKPVSASMQAFISKHR